MILLPVMTAECLKPIKSFFTFNLSKAATLVGIPFGIENYCLISVAFGPSLGMLVQR